MSSQEFSDWTTQDLYDALADGSDPAGLLERIRNEIKRRERILN